MTGKDLRQIREAAGMSIRDVEKEYPGKITKALLSGLENGLVEATTAYRHWICSKAIEKNAGAEIKDLTADCRRESLRKVDKLERCAQIIKALGNRSMTAREIAYYLGFNERNAVAPRLTELCAIGKIVVDGKRWDEETGRNVSTYRKVV